MSKHARTSKKTSGLCKECEEGILKTKTIRIDNKDGSYISKKVNVCSICGNIETIDCGYRRTEKNDGFQE